MNRASVALLNLLAGLIILFYFQSGLEGYLNLDYLKDRQASLIGYYSTHPFTTALVFFMTFMVLVGLSLPVAGIMMNDD